MSTLTELNDITLVTADGTRKIQTLGLPWRWKDFLCWKAPSGRVTYFPWDQYVSFEIAQLVA